MPSTEVALATSTELPGGDPDTALLARALGDAGVECEVVAWSDERVPWASYGATVMRSVWDYHTRPDAFLRWARSVPRLINSASLTEWNADKRYLLDLAGSVDVCETRVLLDPTPAEISAVLAEEGWGDAVLKPAVGLDGHGVTRVGPDRPTARPRRGAWLLQPFAPAIADGELSVVMIEGRPTHAVRRVPAPDDYRTQERFGGSVAPATATDEELALARAAVAAVDEEPLYARADLVSVNGRSALMELELIDPDLFLRRGPDGLKTMVEAVVARIASS